MSRWRREAERPIPGASATATTVRSAVPEFPALGADGGEIPDGLPPGQVYDWYANARALHDEGDAAGAVPLLLWAVAAEPGARSLREALARAQFDARLFAESAAS